MREWILSIGIMIVLTSMISIILPEGKIGKCIKSIFSVLVILTIFNPITKFNFSGYNVEKVISINEICLQENYLDYFFNNKIKTYENTCVNIAENCGVKSSDVKIDYSVKDGEMIIEKISLNLSNAVIISDKAHINIIEEIKQQICSKLNVNCKILVVKN